MVDFNRCRTLLERQIDRREQSHSIVRWEHRVMSLLDLPILPRARYLSHLEACRIVNYARRVRGSSRVVIDLSLVEETTTSAFARFVLYRRELLQQGRDLVLRGLRDRTESLYQVARLSSVLPRERQLA